MVRRWKHKNPKMEDISWEEFEKTLKKRKLAVYKAENSDFLKIMRDEWTDVHTNAVNISLMDTHLWQAHLWNYRRKVNDTPAATSDFRDPRWWVPHIKGITPQDRRKALTPKRPACSES